uniref:(northern house mosquito) hypothetical protein n=1 Tax=Culex pipiens TaxID=7175 RepID=A0A8D8GYI7_CULPI
MFMMPFSRFITFLCIATSRTVRRLHTALLLQRILARCNRCHRSFPQQIFLFTPKPLLVEFTLVVDVRQGNIPHEPTRLARIHVDIAGDRRWERGMQQLLNGIP